jgi:hypothetical protein
MNPTEGIITHPSPYSVPETLDRLEALLQAKNNQSLHPRRPQRRSRKSRQGSLGKGMNDDSLQRAADIKGELLMRWGRQDPHIPLEGRLKVLSRLNELGTRLSWHEVNGAEKAARVMSSKLLSSENENVVFKAASALLDRDERSSKRRKMTLQHNFHEIFTPEKLALAAAVAKEIREYEQWTEGQAQIAEASVIDTSAFEEPDTPIGIR